MSLCSIPPFYLRGSYLKKIVWCLLWLPGVVQAQSDTYNTYEIWTRLMFQKELSPRWEVMGGVNYRRQNNFLEQRENPFLFPQAYLYRLSVNYRTKKDFTFYLSPLLYADNFRLEFTDANRNQVIAVKQREIRFTIGGSQVFTINKLQLRPRLLYEYRHFLETRPQSRVRLQLHFQHPLYKPAEGQTLSLMAFHEVFYNITTLRSLFFDQNRSFLGLFYQTGKTFEYQLGYQYTYQKQASFVLHRSQILLHANVRL